MTSSGQVMPFPQFAALRSRKAQPQQPVPTAPAFGSLAKTSGSDVSAAALRNALIAQHPKFGSSDFINIQPTIVPLPYQDNDGDVGKSRQRFRPSAFVMPSIIEETDEGNPYATDPISYAFNSKNTLYFYTDFNDDSAQDFTSALNYKKNEILRNRVEERGMTMEEARNLTPDDPRFDPDHDIITVDINSPGGVITSLYNMVDTMDSLKKNGIIIQTVAHGLAASCGSLLVALGSPGYRKMTPNSCVMIHQPLGGAQGQATDIQIQNDVIQEMKKKLTWMLYESSTKNCIKAGAPKGADIMLAYKKFVKEDGNAHKTFADFVKTFEVERPSGDRKTFEDFVQAMERDNFLYQQGAMDEYGLIDEIVDT